MLEKLLQFVLKLMPKPIQKLFYRYENIWRYCYYGLWTTVVSGLTKILGKYVIELMGFEITQTIPNLLNTTISWIITAAFAFVVNKKYVFMSKTNTSKALLYEIGTFASARATSFFMELGIMWLTTSYWQWNYILMTILVQFIILTINYIFSKLVVFKKGSEQRKNESDGS